MANVGIWLFDFFENEIFFIVGSNIFKYLKNFHKKVLALLSKMISITFVDFIHNIENTVKTSYLFKYLDKRQRSLFDYVMKWVSKLFFEEKSLLFLKILDHLLWRLANFVSHWFLTEKLYEVQSSIVMGKVISLQYIFRNLLVKTVEIFY